MSQAAPKPPVPRAGDRPRDWLAILYWVLILVAVPIIAFLMWQRPAVGTTLPVLKHDVPAFHRIAPDEVENKNASSAEVTSDTIRDAAGLANHYALQEIKHGQPVSSDAVVAIANSSLISNTIAVGIPADSVSLLGGNIRAGDIVSVTAVPVSDTLSASTFALDRVLVLDVQTNDKASTLVLAIPAARWLEYLDKTRNAAIVIARAVQ